MHCFFRFVFFLLLLAAPTFSEAQVLLERQSPHYLEIESGSVITASFLISNNTLEKQVLKGRVEAPSGWTTIPHDCPSLELAPGESFLQLVAIKPSKRISSGIYSLAFFLENEKSEVLEKSSFQVAIGQTKDVEVFVEPVPKQIFCGEAYTIKMQIKNRGNACAKLAVLARERLGFPLHISPESHITLQPGEFKSVSVVVNTSPVASCQAPHIVTLHIKDLECNEICFAHTTLVEVLPSGGMQNDAYNYYPSTLEFGAGFHGGKKQVYIGSQGCGYLDEDFDKHIDYYFRAPLIQQTDVAYDLTCIQEDAFFRYCDSIQNLYLGNGVYTMTPLTMSYKYGWGAGYATYFGPVEIGAMYVKDSTYFADTNGAYYVAYTPVSWCRLSASQLNTNMDQEASFQLGEPRNAHTYSTRGQLHFCKEVRVDAECAWSKGTRSVDKTHHATFCYLAGEPFKNCWYSFQNIYSHPGFVGFFSDTRQTSASIGFPVYGNVQASVSQNYYSYNLNLNKDKERAPRDKNRWVSISSPLPYGIFASLSYNNATVRDLLNEISYKTNYVSIVANKTFCQWLLQAVCEGGKHTNKNAFNEDRHWQNYQLYAHYRPSSYETYSIYSRQGYQMIVADIRWAQVYGVCFGLCGFRRWDCNLLYEHTLRTKDFKRHFVTGEVKHRFYNEHALKLKGFWNRENVVRYFNTSLGAIAEPKKQTTEIEMLLTYTLPLNLPVSVKKSVGSLQGIVYAQDSRRLERRLGKRVVRCNQLTSLTDQRGFFSFSRLKPGRYYIHLEGEADGLISAQPLPLMVDVHEGGCTNFNISLVREAEVSGRVCYKESETNTLRGASQALIVLYCPRTKERFHTTTNGDGCFVFKHIRPSQWQVMVRSCNLPNHYHFLSQEVEVLLHPGEKKQVLFQAIPEERKIKFIDDGVLEA